MASAAAAEAGSLKVAPAEAPAAAASARVETLQAALLDLLGAAFAAASVEAENLQVAPRGRAAAHPQAYPQGVVRPAGAHPVEGREAGRLVAGRPVAADRAEGRPSAERPAEDRP